MAKHFEWKVKKHLELLMTRTGGVGSTQYKWNSSASENDQYWIDGK